MQFPPTPLGVAQRALSTPKRAFSSRKRNGVGGFFFATGEQGGCLMCPHDAESSKAFPRGIQLLNLCRRHDTRKEIIHMTITVKADEKKRCRCCIMLDGFETTKLYRALVRSCWGPKLEPTISGLLRSMPDNTWAELTRQLEEDGKNDIAIRIIKDLTLAVRALPSHDDHGTAPK